MAQRSYTFESVRYAGSAYTVHFAGTLFGRVSLNRRAYDGWLAYPASSDHALLGEDGFAAEYPTREAAADALYASTVFEWDERA